MTGLRKVLSIWNRARQASTSLATLPRYLQRLHENDLYPLLLRPRVLLNYRYLLREQREKPLLMKAHPCSLEIELTSRCNLACVQCLRSTDHKGHRWGDMGFDHYKKILKQFPYAFTIGLNGFGEATLHPDFAKIVAYTKRVRPWAKVEIYTNGMLLTRDRIGPILKSGLGEINVSLDAARPDTYKVIRRGGDFATVLANVRCLLQMRREAGQKLPRVGLNFVMLDQNEGQLVEFVELAGDLGVDFINCVTYATYDWGFRNHRSPQSYRSEVVAAQQRARERGVRVKTWPSPDLSWTDSQRSFDCDFFWGKYLRVAWNGENTLGCCTPYPEKFSYGNLLSTPWTTIWNGPRYVENRRRAKAGIPPVKACEDCTQFCKDFFSRVPVAL